MVDLPNVESGHVGRVALDRCTDRLNASASLQPRLRHDLTEDFPLHPQHVLVKVLAPFRSDDIDAALLASIEHRQTSLAGR